MMVATPAPGGAMFVAVRDVVVLQPPSPPLELVSYNLSAPFCPNEKTESVVAFRLPADTWPPGFKTLAEPTTSCPSQRVPPEYALALSILPLLSMRKLKTSPLVALYTLLELPSAN